MSPKLRPILSRLRPPFTFRAHLIIALVITMVPLFIFSVVMIYLFAQNDHATFRQGATQRTLALMTAVDTELKSSITTLEALAASRHLENDDLRSFYDEATRVLRTQPDWFTINLALPSGQQVLNLRQPLGEKLPRIVEGPSFKRVLATGRPAVGNLTRGTVIKQHAFTVRVPVPQRGATKYVLTAVVNPGAISALLALQRLPTDWFGGVIDGNNRIVARTVNPEQSVGQFASDSLRNALARSPEGWFYGSTLEGAKVYTPYNRSAFSGWTVALGIPAAIVEASFRSSLLFLASLGVMFLIFGIALAWFVSTRTAKSIGSLASLASDLGSGKTPPANHLPDRIIEVEQVRQTLLKAGRLILERSQERDRVEAALRQVTERLELAQEAGNIGTFERDLITGEIKWSTSQEKLYGLSQGSFGGRHEDWAKHVHPEDIAAVEAAVVRAKETQRPLNVEFRIVRRDGTMRWMASQARVFGDDSGTPRRMLGVNIDVTERKQAEADLIALKNHLAADLHAMSRLHEFGRRCVQPTAEIHDCLGALVETAVAVTGANKGNVQLLDPASGALKLAAHRGFSEPFLNYFAGVHDESSACGAAMQRRERMMVEDVTDSPIFAGTPALDVLLQAGVRAVQSTPLLSSAGNLLGMISTHFSEPHRLSDRDLRLIDLLARQAGDFLERKRTEEALLDADRRKDEFLAVLGHELRNPLGVISNVAQLMRKKKVWADSGLADLEDTMTRQVGQMARLLDDLLDVSRIARGQIRLKEEPCDLTDIVSKAVEDHRSLLKESGLHLVTELPLIPLWIMGDPTRLAQIVGNALHNANKFTDRGGTVTVCLAKAEQGKTALLTVHDTGIGMEPAMLAQVFEPFSQAEHSIDRSRGGLGLGLALVKGLVELQKGQVTIASDGPGRGVELAIRFPLTEAPAQAAKPAEPVHDGARACRILIIEDNRVAAKSTGMFLSATGHSVEVAHDGQAGIEAARRFRPQVVLCDIGLPVMDGYAVCQALRKEPGLNDAFLIAITGYGQGEDQRRTRDVGFDAHLTKPVDLDDVERLLGQFTAQQSKAKKFA